MRIETSLDVEKRIAVVSIYTDDRVFTTTYELDKVVQQLDALASNWFAHKILDMLGFKVDIRKTETPAQTTQKPA